MKEYVALLTVLVLLFSSIPSRSKAADPMTQQQFYEYLDSINKRRISVTPNNFPVNFSIYQKYNLIVYGDPWGDSKPGSQCGNTSERRYLGYNEQNAVVTNTCFPNDADGGGDIENRNWQVVDSELNTWKGLDISQLSQLEYKTMTGNGATNSNFTIASKGGRKYGKVSSLPTLISQGSIFMQHRTSSGGLFYVTFSVPSIGGSNIVAGTLTTPQSTYTITRDQADVSFPVTVTANAQLQGYFTANQIQELKASYNGAEQKTNKSAISILNRDHVLSRANYQPGTHTVKLDGTVELISIFGDRQPKSVTKTITLIVEAEGDEPYVITNASPDPSAKKFDNTDVNVVLTVMGDLKNYTKTANIKEWVFYARPIEASSADIKKNYQKTLVSEATFNYKIPASKITGSNFKQYYSVRARAYFNQAVNGKDFYDAPAETSVNIYKEKPDPNSTNIPPIAIINSPSSIKAGDEFVAHGYESSDEDGTISTYEWNTPGANGEMTLGFGTLWYPVERLGNNNIHLTVVDSGGATGSTSNGVLVTEPYPVAILNFGGTLKENRKATIDGYKSTSPTYYPIDPSRTRMTFTPISGGVAGDIKYLGLLNGALYKEFLIKKAGTYRVQLYVENVAGYSDTTESIITIAPDLPPMTQFSVLTRIFRDNADSNYARMEVQDMSYSPDDDFIADRIWTVKYNANNSKNPDGSPNFSDDISFQIQQNNLIVGAVTNITHGGYTYRVIRISDKLLEIKTKEVGTYLIEQTSVEGFGQPTILDFIISSDYRRGNTIYKPLIEKTIKIDNRPPTADFAP
jgi:hypothetical protein